MSNSRSASVESSRWSGRSLGLALAFGGMLLVSLDSLLTRGADTDGWTVAF